MLFYTYLPVNKVWMGVNPAMVSSNYLVAPRSDQLRQAAASVTQRALKIISLARENDARGSP